MDCAISWFFDQVIIIIIIIDRLYGLVVRVPGSQPRGLWFDSGRYLIFWVAVGLERGPPSPCEDKWIAIWKKSRFSGLEIRN
jgi:hypothetical protein